MTLSKSKRRGYVSPLRAEQAELTERRVLDAMLQLVLERGYPATSVADVAAQAGVSVQTVYNRFGSKASLLKRAYDVALVGDEERVPFAQRAQMQALIAEPDPRTYLLGYARLGEELHDRLGRLMLAITDGARSGDADLIAFVETTNGERLVGTGMAARHLQEMGALRPDVTIEQARDAIWTLHSVQVWDLLVLHRGWSGDAYAAWVGRAMADAVLDH